MIKGRDVRKAEYPIDPLFLDRWSPRAMSGEGIPEPELRTLLAAASWAPSSYNAQPWRMLYAHRATPAWPKFFDLLVEGNRVWAQNAAALILFVSKRVNDATGKPSVTHSFDTGTAWGYFALQAHMRGYAAHGMQGFDYARARQDLGIPELFHVEAMAAVGRPAAKGSLPAHLQEREHPSSRRRLSETVCEGVWSLPG
jgi:nitroreductase